MLRTYFKTAWKIIVRQRIFSLINILGLAIGMVACLLIVQYMSFELSYDRFHKNANQIYRIKHQNFSQGNLIENLPKTYSAIGRALKNEFPEVLEMTRVSKFEGLATAQQPDGSLIAFNERKLYFAEPSFLRLFSFQMLQGSTSALDNPNTIVITEKTARKYFPNQDPISKTIKIQQQVSGTNITATVTGICKDLPVNSHLQFDFIVSMDPRAGNWIYPDYYTYVLLSAQTNTKVFEAKLSPFIRKYTNLGSENTKSSPTMGKSNLTNLTLTLQPLQEIHLYSNLSEEISTGGNGKLV